MREDYEFKASLCYIARFCLNKRGGGGETWRGARTPKALVSLPQFLHSLAHDNNVSP